VGMSKTIDTNKPKVIVLGGSHAHVELVVSLQKRGYFVVLIDYYQNPPAKAVADFHYQESTLNREAVLDIALEIRPVAILNVCLDQPIPIACFVAEKLGLPAPFSSQDALYVTDKSLMKKRLLELDLPTAHFVETDTVVSSKALKLNYPLVVKPSDATGSLGVSKIATMEELESAQLNAFERCRNGKIIIEEFLVGKEVNVYCFVEKGTSFILSHAEKINNNGENGKEFYFVGSLNPARISDSAISKLNRIAQDVVNGFNISDGPLLLQTIINGNEVSIIEIAARMGGGLSKFTLKRAIGFDIMEATIDSLLGLTPRIEVLKSLELVGTCILYVNQGIIKEFVGFNAATTKRWLTNYSFYKNLETEIAPTFSSRNRVAGLVFTGNSIMELNDNLTNTRKIIDVKGMNGESLLSEAIVLKHYE
jgi:formate-dependent phosphoribosylglycinamide formyltransferase (GAR transformylase)